MAQLDPLNDAKDAAESKLSQAKNRLKDVERDLEAKKREAQNKKERFEDLADPRDEAQRKID
jgi:chromosome segregation ATPase